MEVSDYLQGLYVYRVPYFPRRHYNCDFWRKKLNWSKFIFIEVTLCFYIPDNERKY